MRILLILFYILCFSVRASSQAHLTPCPLNTLEARVNDEGLEIGDDYSFADIMLSSNNQIVYVTHHGPLYTPNPNGLWFYDLLEGELFKLTVMDTDLNKINEWGSGEISIPSKFPALVSYIGQEGDYIEIFGTGTNDSLSMIGEFTFFKYTFDATLNLLNEEWFNFSVPIDISLISSVIKNRQGNFVMTGFLKNENLSDRDIFYCEFTEEGEVLTLTTPSQKRNSPWGLTGNEVIQMLDGKYVIHPFNILDEEFNELGYYDDHDLTLSGQITPLDSTRFIFGGTGAGIDGNTIDDLYNYEALCIGNTAGVVDTIYYNSIQTPDVFWMPGYKAISAVDTNHIYFATNRDAIHRLIL